MTLPVKGFDLDQYKAQAKELLKQARACTPDALSRLRAGHPEREALFSKPRLQLADAQLIIARENGCGSWAKLKEYLLFLQAVQSLDAGDIDALGALLDGHPFLIRYHCRYGDYADGYFAGATLLHHVAGNPIRCPLPANILEITRFLLDRGADPKAATSTATTIGLLLTSYQASEARVAVTLIDMLRDAGASDAVDYDDPHLLDDPIWNCGLETARELVGRGARMDLPQASALGRLDVVRQIMDTGEVDSGLLETALIFACGQEQVEAARYLVAHGARGDVVPASALRRGGVQATALHHAAGRGSTILVELLLANGCQATIRDSRWDGTAAGWADHGGHAELAALLRRHEDRSLSRLA